MTVKYRGCSLSPFSLRIRIFNRKYVDIFIHVGCSIVMRVFGVGTISKTEEKADLGREISLLNHHLGVEVAMICPDL